MDVIIVGGGPAGSSCAWALRQRGVDCLILDRERFPRLKLCGGVVAPELVRALRIDVAAYPHGWHVLQRFHFWYKGRRLVLPSPQNSIRRIEFDHWLLERSGAEVRQHYVRDIAADGDGFVIDDAYRCTYLVGAGGTRCPVYGTLFKEVSPRDDRCQIAVLEEEFPCDWEDGDCHFWMFDDGLPGYSWYIPKAGGYLNVGVGGLAARLKANHDTIKRHWDGLLGHLDARGIAAGHDWKPGGYTFYLRVRPRAVRLGNAFIAGDAVGLATHDLGEGIRPAVLSALRVADAITAGAAYGVDGIARYSAGSLVRSAFRRLLRSVHGGGHRGRQHSLPRGR